MSRRYLLFVSVLVAISSYVPAQNQPPSDPTALSLAAQSVTAMAGSNTVSDVTASGIIDTWMVGSTADSGTVTLKVKGYGESRIDMQLVANGALSEIRDASTGIPQGEWINTGTGTIYSQQLCATDAAWFYPLNSAMAVAPSDGIVLSYVGLETFAGSQVQHIQSYNYQPGLDSGSQAQLQLVSTVDYYLDATSFLPVAEDFNLFADNNTAIPVQVLFLNYLTVGGVASPQHIQKLVNGTLQFDATVTSVSLNAGIPLSTFTIPQVSCGLISAANAGIGGPLLASQRTRGKACHERKRSQLSRRI